MTEKPIITDLTVLDALGRAEEIDVVKENKLMREIVSNIKRTMRKNDLVSLSAPVIGYNKRIFCIDFKDQEIKTFINPLITNMSGIELSREICSAIPGKEFIRPRNKTIDIMYTNAKGQVKSNQFKGLAAMVVQHELDHLENITLADIGLEIESDFDEATDEERQEILDMYLDSLDISKKDIIDSMDKDTKEIYEADKLFKLMGEGKITLEAVQAIPEDNKED